MANFRKLQMGHVAGCMGMYPVSAAGDMAVDGIFWQLLAVARGSIHHARASQDNQEK